MKGRNRINDMHLLLERCENVIRTCSIDQSTPRLHLDDIYFSLQVCLDKVSDNVHRKYVGEISTTLVLLKGSSVSGRITPDTAGLAVSDDAVVPRTFSSMPGQRGW